MPIDDTAPASNTPATTTSAPPPNRALRTVAFVAAMGAVLALFTALSAGDKPPSMPAAGPHHQLRFNLKGTLVGLQSDLQTDPLQEQDPAGRPKAGLLRDDEFHVEKKAVEGRINTTCQTCHGTFESDRATHACGTGVAPCVPVKHPPKNECIKCHRMPER